MTGNGPFLIKRLCFYKGVNCALRRNHIQNWVISLKMSSYKNNYNIRFTLRVTLCQILSESLLNGKRRNTKLNSEWFKENMTYFLTFKKLISTQYVSHLLRKGNLRYLWNKSFLICEKMQSTKYIYRFS